MANTKIPIELSSTPSIVDNGDAAAITIDSSEKSTFSGDVEVGTTAPKINLKNTDTSIVADQSLGVIEVESSDGSTGSAGTIAKLDIAASGTFDGSGHGSDFRFITGATNQSGSISLSEKLRIQTTGGISFNGDTAAANALDDYEEGTWTPQITASAGSAGTAAYSNQVGRYTKIGNKVFFEFSVVMTNKGSWSSYTRVLGFPFTTASTGLTAFAVARFPDDTIGAGMVAGELQPSSTYSFFTTGSRLDTLHNISNVDTGYYLVGAGHYTIQR